MAGKFNPKHLVFEDADMARRLSDQTKGKKISNVSVITSSRKFKTNGEIKLTSIFLYLWVLYLLGVSHDKILSIYQHLIVQDKI